MIQDAEVSLLAALAESLRKDYVEDEESAWASSPFGWIKTRPSRQVGVIGEKLVAGWCAAHDFNVLRSPDSDADRVVEGVRTEIKFSTLWRQGFYKFQQIRDQRYDLLVCLGVSPLNAHCWVFRKDEIVPRIGKVECLVPQHGGSAGTDTAWLSINPSKPPAWLLPYGGTLAGALERLRSLVRPHEDE